MKFRRRRFTQIVTQFPLMDLATGSGAAARHATPAEVRVRCFGRTVRFWSGLGEVRISYARALAHKPSHFLEEEEGERGSTLARVRRTP